MGLMYGTRDQTATIPLGTLRPRAMRGRPKASLARREQRKPTFRCLGCGREAGVAHKQVALEPGMLRTVLPWILAPWAALAFAAWVVWG